jgi:hypothetical protein
MQTQTCSPARQSVKVSQEIVHLAVKIDVSINYDMQYYERIVVKRQSASSVMIRVGDLPLPFMKLN